MSAARLEQRITAPYLHEVARRERRELERRLGSMEAAVRGKLRRLPRAGP